MTYTHNASAPQADTRAILLGDNPQGEQVAEYRVLAKPNSPAV